MIDNVSHKEFMQLADMCGFDNATKLVELKLGYVESAREVFARFLLGQEIVVEVKD